MDKEIIKTYKTQGFEVIYSYVINEWENPNQVWGIWEPAQYHDAGTTVQNPEAGRNDHKYYTSINYKPSELASQYAAQGRKNPSKEAYDSLQKELLHYLYGTCFTAEIEIKRGGILLAGDCISSDYSDYCFSGLTIEDEAERVAKEHFSITSLIKEARIEAGRKILQLA